MEYNLVYLAVCLLAVLACSKPLGSYLARVFAGERLLLTPVLGWLERALYKACGIDPQTEMNWKQYSLAVVLLGVAGFALLFVILLSQAHLPLNPEGFGGLPVDLAFNAAVSFVTNTNWQAYAGESSLSYFSQMAGLSVQNFLSAATGMAVAVALFRGIARKQTQMLGNFWVDVTRITLYVLFPLSLLFALFLASQGVIQNFGAYTAYAPLEPAAAAQHIPGGPVASQVAIKMLGSNGGGYFSANGAHPFENPTALTNFLQIISILLIPAALVYCFGVMSGDRRQAWVLLAAMVLIFAPLTSFAVYDEMQGNPRFDGNRIDNAAGNMEGKEMRIGAGPSAIWAVSTTATSNGSVNAMHDSFMPLAGMVTLIFIQFGEVIFGGVGSGAYGMLMYVVLTVFIGGLMVGRTPEYLGKKLGPFEIKMASLFIIIPAFVMLVGTAIAVGTEAGRAGVHNPGAQGFTEVLYAFASASNNNGSAFAGLNANSPFYNILLAVAMIAGRYGLIIPVLALAGSLASKNTTPAGLGTLSTHTPLFCVMLTFSILMLDVLTYVPVLAMGPVAEFIHLQQPGATLP